MKKLIIPIIAFIGISFNANAQGKSVNEVLSINSTEYKKSPSEIKGDRQYFVYNFDKAIIAYKQTKQLSTDGQRRLAISYHSMDKYTESEEAYAKLITAASEITPEDYFNYAMVLKSDGKYDESNKEMNEFVKLKPTDLRAKDYINHKDNLVNLQTDNGKFKTDHLTINTDAEDFGTCYYKDKIVFASTRSPKAFPKNSKRNGKPYLDIYVSAVENNQLKEPENFDKTLNGKFNNGPASFSKDGNFMAFTQNNYDLKRKEKVVKLEIFFRTYSEGKWSKPVAFNLNNKDYSVGHPALSEDGKTMYFTSDMPGGFGGTDIYKTKKDEKGEWGKPENLGDKINTEGDEMFPFYNADKGILFFSSNGRYGLGGLDIFICVMNNSEVGTVYNAGAPLNTKYDDFALIGDKNLSKGYFSSNRFGGSGDDDIYSIDFLKTFEISKKINGVAKDKDGKPVPKTAIALLDEKGNKIDSVITKEDGVYSFSVDTDKKYKLTGKKEKYIDGETPVNTLGKELIVNADVTLLQKEEPVVVQKTEPKNDLGKLMELAPIYFDLDKSNIRPDAEVELKKIIVVMNQNPTMVVELRSYTDCRESAEYNQLLSDKRAKTSAWYIKARITKPERINGKGYGKTDLVNKCTCNDNVGATCTEQEHQQNRRTEFIIIKKSNLLTEK